MMSIASLNGATEVSLLFRIQESVEHLELLLNNGAFGRRLNDKMKAII